MLRNLIFAAYSSTSVLPGVKSGMEAYGRALVEAAMMPEAASEPLPPVPVAIVATGVAELVGPVGAP